MKIIILSSFNTNKAKVFMCLAVPMKLIEKDGDRGIAELGGVKQNINLLLVPETETADYMIVHVGCTIAVLNEKEALNTITLFHEMAEKNKDIP
jgi:hydrogenase expression/formation protein HypC